MGGNWSVLSGNPRPPTPFWKTFPLMAREIALNSNGQRFMDKFYDKKVKNGFMISELKRDYIYDYDHNVIYGKHRIKNSLAV